MEETQQPQISSVNLNRDTAIDQEGVDCVMKFHPWKQDQVEKGNKVRESLGQALKVIIENVPPSPDRSSAIRKLRECRMDCNSAITFNGAY